MSSHKRSTDNGRINVDDEFLLVDEDRTDLDASSDEVAVVGDSCDLYSLSGSEKEDCERRLKFIYEAVCNCGRDLILALNSDPETIIMRFSDLDNIRIQDRIYNEQRISEAVINLFVERLPLRLAAEKMGIFELDYFDFIVYILDHLWKERDKAIEGYSLLPLVQYVNLEKQAVRSVASYVRCNKNLRLSVLLERTLFTAPEIVVTMTILLAELRGWPIAQELNRNWHKAVTEADFTSDDDNEIFLKARELVEYGDDVLKLIKGVQENINNMLSAEEFPSDVTSSDAVDFESGISELRDGMVNLPSAKSIPQRKILSAVWNAKGQKIEKELASRPKCAENQATKQAVSLGNMLVESRNAHNTNTQRPSLSFNSQRITPSVASGVASTSTTEQAESIEEIKVIDVSERSSNYQTIYKDASELDLNNLKLGTYVIAKKRNVRNYLKAQIVNKMPDSDSYKVLFVTGDEEENVDSSRIAIEFHYHLKFWEGMRVCAFYEQRPNAEKPIQSAFYSGTIGVGPHYSSQEMLIFFDNGCDQMVKRENVYLMAQQCYVQNPISNKLEFDHRNNWKLAPKSRQLFLKHYLKKFPDFQLVRMKRKENTQRVNVSRDGKPCSAYVLDTDRQFALLRFPPSHRSPGSECVDRNCQRHQHIDELIYRGSERLDAIRQTIEREERKERQERAGVTSDTSRRDASRHQQNFEYAIPMPRSVIRIKSEPDSELTNFCPRGQALFSGNDDFDYPIRRQQTARKSSSKACLVVYQDVGQSSVASDSRNLHSRRGKYEYLPIPNPNHIKYEKHIKCSKRCLKGMEKDPEKERGTKGLMSPYMLPLRCGWTRQIAKFNKNAKMNRNRRCRDTMAVFYAAPCGVKIYDMHNLAIYLKETCSLLTIDLFTFDKSVRPNVIYRSPQESKLLDDFTKGCEALPIAVYNEVDGDRPPQVRYESRRYAFNKNTEMSTVSSEFCAGCSCTGDCFDEQKCECRRLTRTEVLRLEKSLQPGGSVVGYAYRTLPLRPDDNFYSGIYECNDNCMCSRSRCFNRVVQQDIKIPLELFKTPRTGWGVRSLVDIPLGVFVCTYAGAILTDAQAEEQGKLRGDEYFADINLVENLETAKRNAGVDIDGDGDYFSDEGLEKSSVDGSGPRQSSAINRDDTDYESLESDSSDSSYETKGRPKKKQARTDLPAGEMSKESSSSNLTSDGHSTHVSDAMLSFAMNSLVVGDQDDDVVVIEDDDISRDSMCRISFPTRAEGERFNMLHYMENKYNMPCLYTVDAKEKGNIGRFFNHSCAPNLQTFHVYVDTYDFRLPWIAFFTCKKVSAGEELCWDYRYTEGAIDGKRIDCYCGQEIAENGFCDLLSMEYYLVLLFLWLVF